jgi:thiol:disulfide interchange protein DsbG
MSDLGFSGTPAVMARADDGSLLVQSGVPRGDDLERLFGPL